LIRRLLAVGFSISELSEILKIRDGGGSPCRKVKKLLDEKLSRLDEQNLRSLGYSGSFANSFAGLGPAKKEV
jgi:DNA-binding transcriptional MerR regulator